MFVVLFLMVAAAGVASAASGMQSVYMQTNDGHVACAEVEYFEYTYVTSSIWYSNNRCYIDFDSYVCWGAQDWFVSCYYDDTGCAEMYNLIVEGCQ